MMTFNWKDQDALIKICSESKTQKEILEKMGYRGTGSAHKTLKKYCEKYGIEIPNGYQGRVQKGNQFETEQMLVENSPHSTGVIKKRILKENLIDYKCSDCENEGLWRGRAITLQLDHINGDPKDHRIENLRFLCPNCHSQTGTWGQKRRIPVLA